MKKVGDAGLKELVELAVTCPDLASFREQVGRGSASGGAETMLKGASRALLKIVEREMHEAWRRGYEEGRKELAQAVVPEIVKARFGPEVLGMARAAVMFTDDDRLAEVILRAAACPDFGSVSMQALRPQRKRRR